jgi:hypothetical protein
VATVEPPAEDGENGGPGISEHEAGPNVQTPPRLGKELGIEAMLVPGVIPDPVLVASLQVGHQGAAPYAAEGDDPLRDGESGQPATDLSGELGESHGFEPGWRMRLLTVYPAQGLEKGTG